MYFILFQIIIFFILFYFTLFYFILKATARNIRLVVMPQGMSRRALNSSQYRPKSDLILWRLHIVFIINNSYLPSMILKPENSNIQNNNFGEFDLSSSLMSLTGKKIF